MTGAARARGLAACCGLWLAALLPPAAAQTVPVRSGAHDGFDRIVLDMPERRAWWVVPREGGATLLFDGDGLRFDLGTVFARIGRARLRAIADPGAGNRLDLVLDCDCRIAPVWHDGDMLVIDIGAPSTAVSAAAAPAAALVRPRLRGAMPLGAGPSSAAAALAARLDARPGPRRETPPDAGAAAPDGALDAMRDDLVRQLGRAASQGLLSLVPDSGRPRTGPIADPDGMSAPPAAVPPAAVSPAPAKARATPREVPGLRITTGMDRARPGPPLPSQATGRCPAPALLDVPSWGGTQPLAREIGQLNAALFGEFDTVREDTALRLARLYIHHGFGAEARQVLGWLGEATRGHAEAQALARLVDGVPAPAGGTLAAALDCGEPGVLWALLSLPDLPPERVFDHRALQRSFLALPDGLRRVLGPGLVRRLTGAGHHRTAETILRHLRGGDAPADAETGLARAALARDTGKEAQADAALREIVRSNTPQTGLALAQSIERALARAAPVDFDEAQLAGALAFEHRGTPLGVRLALAYLSALAASGAFEEAMAEFARLRPSVAEAEAARVASVLVSYLQRGADDVTFLRAMLTDRLVAPGALDDSVALAVAQRLLALGFAEHAARHLAAPGPQGARPQDRARRLLRARIALEQDRPADALAEVAALDGEEAGLLRAEALALSGDHEAARRLFAAHDAARGADRAALHSGRAVALAGAEAPPLRAMGSLLAQAPPAAAAAEGAHGIDAHRALLAQSLRLRDATAQLLAATPGRAAAPEPDAAR